MSLKAVDMFCGAGGMSYGLSLAGIEVIVGIDVDEKCRRTYEENNQGSKFLCADIGFLGEEELKRMFGLQRIDDELVFVGCNPCQYWTQLNTRRERAEGTKDLLVEFQRFVEYFMPGYVVVENVRGVLSKRDDSGLSEFLDFLEASDYGVDYGILNANNYGVPQTRKRFLLVGSRIYKGIKLPKPEKGNCLKVRDVIGVKNGFASRGAGNVDKSDFMHTTAGLSEKNIRRLEMTPRDGGMRLAWKDDRELQITAYRGKDDSFKDNYGRMFWGKPAPTITTKFYSISNGRFGHPEENRGISLREGATLQTFPKEYVFRGSGIISIGKQIGNAVPPQLARRIGISLMNEANQDANIN